MWKWLEALPFDMVYKDLIYVCHGTPTSDTEYLLEEISPGDVKVKDEDVVMEALNGINQNIILSGHSHVSRILETDNKTIINPGSVGLQAYDDNSPCYHKMENFSPKARYTVLDPRQDKLTVEQISIDYDFERAVERALKNGRDDWAGWLSDGRVD